MEGQTRSGSPSLPYSPPNPPSPTSVITFLASQLRLSALSLLPPPIHTTHNSRIEIFNSRLTQVMQEAGRKQMLQGGHEDTSTLRQVTQA